MPVFKQLQLITVSEATERKKSARQSKPPNERLIVTNDNDVSDEEVAPVCPKRKSKKSASGDGDVPPMEKSRKSKLMNTKEYDSLKASISLNPSVFHGIIADKFKAKQTQSQKLKQLTSSCWERIGY